MRFPAGCWRRSLATILVGIALLWDPVRASPAEQPSGQDKPLEADILLSAARNALQRGDLPTALQRFSQFRKQYPDREDGRRGYADMLFRAGRVDEALPEYEHLFALHPNDPELVRTFVDALLGVGDHPRAKARLADAMARFPERTDFALSLALLHALDEETAEADELIRKFIAGRPLGTLRMRLDAAALYVQLRRPDAARPILAELQKAAPDDARVLALCVRYALLTKDYQEAVRQADKLNRLHPGTLDLRLELASALYAAGDYSEAGRLFAEVLKKTPRNDVALLGSARVAMRDYRMADADAILDQVSPDMRGRQWRLATAERDTIVGDYRRARGTLDELLQENPDDHRASMALADLHRAENEFIKADVRYMGEGATANNTVAGRHYATSLYLQCRYEDAECVCRQVLALDPADTGAVILLARTLMKVGRCEEAAEVLRSVQEISKTASPEEVYFARFLPSGSEPQKSDQSRPVYLAVTLSDLAMEDGWRTWAKQILVEALAADPANVVLRTRLAEWHASFGVADHACCAAAIYADLLSQEPDNHKWLLGLARAKVTMRCYDQALVIYRRLRCESPDNYLIARETARVVFFVCGSPKGLNRYDDALCDWPGPDEEARRLCTERLAKSTHFSATSVAASAYGDILSDEPYEQHIAFELGQVHGLMGTTSDAIDAYSHLLAVNPNHRDAQVAIEGKQLERCRELMVDHRFIRERGRDGLTSIDRLGEFVAYQLPRTDENEHLSVGYGRLSLAPTYGAGTLGDALVVRAQKQVHGDFGPWLSPYVPMALFLDCEVQRYDRYVSTRPVFEAGVKLHTCNDLVLTVSGTMNNVLENGESMQQDIYRGGLRTDLVYWHNNYWENEAAYEFQGYSDNNTRQSAEFRSRLQMTPDPRRISLLADGYYWNFAQPSVFSPGPDPFDNMTHPYWTPMNYYMAGIGVEYKRWLSCDRFDGAQHCWVSFSAMKRWDCQQQNYTLYRGMMCWDITRRLSGHAAAEYTDGAPYRSAGTYGGLNWKF
jgi:tetratricopeptide (TPR) repeat protein